jgi:hypothetical protein
MDRIPKKTSPPSRNMLNSTISICTTSVLTNCTLFGSRGQSCYLSLKETAQPESR